MTNPTYTPTNTALLMVDPYNDFMSEGGKLYEATQETANDVGTYANLRQLLPAVRNAGIQVIVVPHHRARGGDYAAWMHPNPTQLGGQELMPFAEGTWGGAWNPEFGAVDACWSGLLRGPGRLLHLCATHGEVQWLSSM